MRIHVALAIAVLSGALSMNPAAAADSTAKAPVKKSQSEIQNQIAISNARIAQLEKEKAQAAQFARVKAPVPKEGLTLLKKYDTLLRARYVDEEGSFEPAIEIAPADRDNINHLFRAYLHWVPLKGRVSAGKARKTIASGIDTLSDWASGLESPDENNNSDIQIISKRLDDERDNVGNLTELASNLGYKVDERAVARNIPAQTPSRMPASTPSP